MMLRTQISLTERERQLLDAASARTGRSMSALIREAIDGYYGDGGAREHNLAGMRAGFGAWSERDGEDGAAYVERLRSARRVVNR